jgi:hypothetical protein
VLDSPLSFDDCLRSLRDQAGTFSRRPIQRSLIPRSDGILLRRRHRFLSNSFETVADARLQPGGQGTQVHVAFRTSYVMSAFITLWVGFAIVVNLVIVANGHLSDLVVTLSFPALGFGWLAFGRLRARRDRTALMEFVGRVTEGRLTQ